MRLPQEAAELARSQMGLLTIGQLRDAGVTGSQVRWNLGRTWRLVLPHVVATFTGRLDDRQRLVAAQLYAGPGAMVTGATAARWHGVTAAEDHRVHMEVPHDRRPRGGAFVVVRRTTRPDPHPWQRPPFTLVSRERAVATAARDSRLQRTATALVLEAVQRRLVRTDDLRHELEVGPRAGSAVLRRAAEAAEAGMWSAPEADLAQLFCTSRLLPTPWFNPDLYTADGLRLPRPDGWFDEVALAVQVHSYRHHARPQDWDGTVMTDGVLVEQGVVVLGVTPRAIVTRPADVLARIERVYEQARRRPRPDVVAVPIASAA